MVPGHTESGNRIERDDVEILTNCPTPEGNSIHKGQHMIAGLTEVILYVGDMAEAVAFYRDRLGLKIVDPHCEDYSQEYWVVLDTGACRLCLHGGGEHRQGADAPKIVFRVEDVETARTHFLDRGVALSEVRSPAPGVLVCDGVDPSGNPFSIEQA